MSTLEMQYETSIQEIKSRYFSKLSSFAAGISYLFCVYFTLLLKMQSVGIFQFSVATLYVLILLLHKYKFLKYIHAVHLFNFSVLISIIYSSYIGGGLTSPGIFFFPLLPISTALLLNKKSAQLWGAIAFSVAIVYLILKINGHTFLNYQDESKRHISHFMNFSMIFLYIYSLSMLSFKLKEEVENTNNIILRDLYNENRLNNVSQIVGGIAHEINNPLSISSGNIMLLQKHLDGLGLAKDEKINRLIGNMNVANDRISNIVKDLKFFNNNEKSKYQSFNLCQSVAETVNFLKETMVQNQVYLEFENPKFSDLVDGVPNQFQQVLLNLLKNSMDALEGRDHKIIDVNLTKNSVSFVLKIIDNGAGISQENLKKIFDPFFTTKGENGTGLGLGITRSILKDMKAQIHYESTLNKGTEVTLTLPINSQVEKIKHSETAA